MIFSIFWRSAALNKWNTDTTYIYNNFTLVLPTTELLVLIIVVCPSLKNYVGKLNVWLKFGGSLLCAL